MKVSFSDKKRPGPIPDPGLPVILEFILKMLFRLNITNLKTYLFLLVPFPTLLG